MKICDKIMFFLNYFEKKMATSNNNDNLKTTKGCLRAFFT